jgi:hypothetical protein
LNQAKFFGLIVVATAALLLSDNTVISQTGGVCSGKLVKEKDGTLTLVDGEVICEVDPGGTQKVLAVCAEGHDCQVTGKKYPCEDSGECETIKNITIVKDLTKLGQQK